MKNARELIEAAQRTDWEQRERTARGESLEWLDQMAIEAPEQTVVEHAELETEESAEPPLDEPESPEMAVSPTDSPDVPSADAAAVDPPEIPDESEITFSDEVLAEQTGGEMFSGQELQQIVPDAAGLSQADTDRSFDEQPPDSPSEFEELDLPDGQVVSEIGDEILPEQPESFIPDAPESPDDDLGVELGEPPQIANLGLPEISDVELPVDELDELTEPESFEDKAEAVDYPETDTERTQTDNVRFPEVESYQSLDSIDSMETDTEQTQNRQTDNSAEDQIDYPDLPPTGFDSLSIPEQDSAALTEPETPEMGFRGFEDLPPMTMEQAEMDKLADPSVSHDERVERQYEAQRRSEQEFASQLAQELQPSFDEMRMIYTAEARDYLDEQVLYASILRVR